LLRQCQSNVAALELHSGGFDHNRKPIGARRAKAAIVPHGGGNNTWHAALSRASYPIHVQLRGNQVPETDVGARFASMREGIDAR